VMRKFWMQKGQSNYQLKFILEGKTSDLHTHVKIIFSVIFYRPYWKMYYFNFCCWFLMFSYVLMLSMVYRFLPFSLWKRWIEVSLYTKYLLFRVSNFHGFLILLLCNCHSVSIPSNSFLPVFYEFHLFTCGLVSHFCIFQLISGEFVHLQT
jgi:hypothetical protein